MQKKTSESTGLRAGRRGEKRASQQREGQGLPPPGPEPRGQPLPPQMEETTRAATADPNTRAAGRDPGCNMKSPIKGDQEERAQHRWNGTSRRRGTTDQGRGSTEGQRSAGGEWS